MIEYKKIIKNKELRFKILKVMKIIPDPLMLRIQYRIKMGRALNINTPHRWTEKLQWYKTNYKNPLLTKCADKYEVREYVKEQGLEEILVKLYGVYDNVNEINFDSLPEKFVMKTTNGSGTNIICKNKEEMNINDTKQTLNSWLKRDNYSAGREWSYKNLKPKIIIEEFLEDEMNRFEGINDYKFICFDGEAKYIVFDVDRHVNHKRNIYDTDWNFIDVSTDHPNLGDTVTKPKGLTEMLIVANKLASDFPFVRVDLYWVNNKVYFGELTFYPWTGYVQFSPDEFDLTLGHQFNLPEVKK